MAFSAREFEVGGATPAAGTDRPANELSYQQLQHGVVFKSDIEADFRLEDPDLEDEYEYFEGEVDEEELAWTTASDPSKLKPTIGYLRERPKLLEELILETENLTADGGVKKWILEPGSGGMLPPAKSKVYFHYSAWSEERPEPFDTSLGRSAETLIAGEKGDIIPGLRVAVESMKLHEVSQFVVHYDYAYGKMGCAPRVGKESTIIFTIKVVHFLTEERLKNILCMTPSQRNDQSFTTILDGVKEVRENGNRLYRGANYHKAIREYRNCTEILESYWGIKTEVEEDSRHEFLCGVYCNMAAAYLKLDKGPQACNACKNAMRYKVDSYMGRIYILSGRAQAAVGSYDEGIKLLETALAHGGHKGDCGKYKAEMLARKQDSERRHKQMCQSMFRMKEIDNRQKERAGTTGTAAEVSCTSCSSVSNSDTLRNESRAAGLPVNSGRSKTYSFRAFKAEIEGEYSGGNVGGNATCSIDLEDASSTSSISFGGSIGSYTSDEDSFVGNAGKDVSASIGRLTLDSVAPVTLRGELAESGLDKNGNGSEVGAASKDGADKKDDDGSERVGEQG